MNGSSKATGMLKEHKELAFPMHGENHHHYPVASK